jgi:hypothetical protein
MAMPLTQTLARDAIQNMASFNKNLASQCECPALCVGLSTSTAPRIERQLSVVPNHRAPFGEIPNAKTKSCPTNPELHDRVYSVLQL